MYNYATYKIKRESLMYVKHVTKEAIVAFEYILVPIINQATLDYLCGVNKGSKIAILWFHTQPNIQSYIAKNSKCDNDFHKHFTLLLLLLNGIYKLLIKLLNKDKWTSFESNIIEWRLKVVRGIPTQKIVMIMECIYVNTWNKLFHIRMLIRRFPSNIILNHASSNSFLIL